MGLSEIKVEVGGVNTDVDQVVSNVQSSIRRQLPQVRPYQVQPTPIALVAGGPSLSSTLGELRDAIFRGCKVATVNGAYQWCIDRNIKPDMAIALDARPGNAEFFETSVPGCKYLLASQSSPEMFDVVDGRDVFIFHALSYESVETPILDEFYMKAYTPVTGGSTVTVRALSLLRMLGFLRMDVFGFDSCWMGRKHHAYRQELNDADKRIRVVMRVGDADDRTFWCAPWHVKQLDDFKMWVKERGHLCDLHVHGDGLIAHTMKTGARLVHELSETEQTREVACA